MGKPKNVTNVSRELVLNGGELMEDGFGVTDHLLQVQLHGQIVHMLKTK